MALGGESACIGAVLSPSLFTALLKLTLVTPPRHTFRPVLLSDFTFVRYPTLKLLYADDGKVDEVQYKGHRTLVGFPDCCRMPGPQVVLSSNCFRMSHPDFTSCDQDALHKFAVDGAGDPKALKQTAPPPP
eukprot:2771822-Rhodomonas_salina.1